MGCGRGFAIVYPRGGIALYGNGERDGFSQRLGGVVLGGIHFGIGGERKPIGFSRRRCFSSGSVAAKNDLPQRDFGDGLALPPKGISV